MAPMPQAPQPHPVVFVTDLDGPLTEGSSEDERRLREFLQQRPHCSIIYATDRCYESAKAMKEVLHLPEPDVCITDAGSSVVSRRTGVALNALERDLDRRWPGDDAIRRRLDGLSHRLEEHAIHAPRRLSYFVRSGCDADQVQAEVAQALAGLEVTVTTSQEADIDILPEHVDKGGTLLSLLEHLDVEPDWVVVGGRLLQDRELCDSKLKGFVLADATPELKASAEKRQDRFVTPHAGAAGMLEGLNHFGVL